MPFPLNILAPQHHPSSSQSDGYDSSSSTDSASTARSSSRNSNRHHRTHRTPFVTSNSSAQPALSGAFLGDADSLLPPAGNSGRSSVSSTATNTPVPSRSPSPLPQFYASAPSSTYTSDADSEPTSPLLARSRRSRWWNEDRRPWWITDSDGRKRRRRRDSCLGLRSIKRAIRMVIRHPLFPTQPTSIILTLFLLTIFAILLTLLLIHILNPDKEPLPWRAYCSIPSTSSAPPSLNAPVLSPAYPFNALTPSEVSSLSSSIDPPFPPAHLDDLPPAGLFIGVFSMDSSTERRMLVRSTWASHLRSRNGAGVGDGGLGTSRTIVRFVLGKPRGHYERRIQLEAETYNDMIILPISENMNSGKTHSFFTWAANEAWVPPLPANTSSFSDIPNFSYSNVTAAVPLPLAPHDPEALTQKPWVRPDFVAKVDDDSFVMLAELEARLRLELHAKKPNLDEDAPFPRSEDEPKDSPTHLYSDPKLASTSLHPLSSALAPPSTLNPQEYDDPLVYWGYLVKNQFMAGELYALSWSIVSWAARDPSVRGMTRGKEDKQVAKWMRAHPRAKDVRWKTDHCWIYDHPRAGTVYSHGFLFPSEVTRVKKNIMSYFSSTPDADPQPPQDHVSADSSPSLPPSPPKPTLTPTTWAHSSVATFGVRYAPPVPDLSTLQSVEALVEGAAMSSLHDGGDVTPGEAWARREGRAVRYEEHRVGGTIVVHFIKKNPWYLETALALLEGEEVTAMEARRRDAERAVPPAMLSLPLRLRHR